MSTPNPLDLEAALEDALAAGGFEHAAWRQLRLALGAVRQALGAERHFHDAESERLLARAVRRIRTAQTLSGAVPAALRNAARELT